jgi:type I restriction enzyme R subunit
MPPDAFISKLRKHATADIAAWFTQCPDLGEILDRKNEGPGSPVFVSNHPDRLLGSERGYGQAQRPRTTSRPSASSSTVTATTSRRC